MMIAFVLFALAVFIVLAGVDPQVVDDTFITFQYAQNLVEYGRLTWWPFGEMVDGFTSPGHTLLLASGMALGFSPMGTNMAINLIAMALILMGVAQGTRELKFMPRYLAIGFVSLSAPFIIWYGGGLDGIIYSAVLFWIYLTFENSLRKAALSWPLIGLLVLLPVIRPEGLLISPGDHLLGMALNKTSEGSFALSQACNLRSDRGGRHVDRVANSGLRLPAAKHLLCKDLRQ